MTDRDRLGTTLDALVPPFEDDPFDWDDVLRRAGEQATPSPVRRPRRRRALAFAALGVLAAICAVALADPFADEETGVLDRALAAVGDGPVLHVITRSGTIGTLVDLSSGEGRPLQIETEAWFDPARGFRSTTRLEDTVLSQYGAPVDKPIRFRAADRAMQVFTRDYRDALRTGRARVLRQGSVAGTSVYWIRITLERRAPDGSPCGRHFCQDVAVSRETYEPVYVHFGPARIGFGERIIELESLPAGSGEIPGKASDTTFPGFVPLPRRSVDRSVASRLLETPLAWPGSRLAGLRLQRIVAGGEREFRFNASMRRPRFKPRNHVITLVFGVRDQLMVNEARRSTYGLLRGPAAPGPTPYGVPVGYVPRRGSALVARGGHQAILRRGNLVIGIVGSHPDEVRAALRAVSRAR